MFDLWWNLSLGLFACQTCKLGNPTWYRERYACAILTFSFDLTFRLNLLLRQWVDWLSFVHFPSASLPWRVSYFMCRLLSQDWIVWQGECNAFAFWESILIYRCKICRLQLLVLPIVSLGIEAWNCLALDLVILEMENSFGEIRFGSNLEDANLEHQPFSPTILADL